MQVSEILKVKGERVVTVEPDTKVGDLCRLLAREGIGSAVVVEGTRILGVVAERDIVHALAARGAAVLDQAVNEITSAVGVVCAPDDPITGVMVTMTNRRVRHLPVIAGRKMVGLISIGDVVKHRLHEIEEEANTLRDYITAR